MATARPSLLSSLSISQKVDGLTKNYLLIISTATGSDPTSSAGVLPLTNGSTFQGLVSRSRGLRGGEGGRRWLRTGCRDPGWLTGDRRRPLAGHSEERGDGDRLLLCLMAVQKEERQRSEMEKTSSRASTGVSYHPPHINCRVLRLVGSVHPQVGFSRRRCGTEHGLCASCGWACEGGDMLRPLAEVF